jgi:hypothetical protein
MGANDIAEQIGALLAGGAQSVALQGARGGALALTIAQLTRDSGSPPGPPTRVDLTRVNTRRT